MWVENQPYTIPHTIMFLCVEILTRLCMVIHGDVDGFTRIPVFFHCFINKAAIVVELFLNTAENYGLHQAKEAGNGRENVDVTWYMLNHPLRGPGKDSMIFGHSVSNLRFLL